jgi:SAM-dependent methyltransferase
MKDLSAFADASFDLVFHPVSNLFAPDVEPVWKECARILRKGGRLLAGFCNPLTYIFDLKVWEATGELKVRYKIPYSDLDQLPPDELAERMAHKGALEYGHSLDSQIGGQLKAGFAMVGFFEDISNWGFLDPHIKTFIASCCLKL